MKIYFAARYSRYPEMQRYARDVEALDYEVTSRWIVGDHDIRAHSQSEALTYMPMWANEDRMDLLAADICISFTEAQNDEVPGRSRGGRHVEFGLALALAKQCMVVGYRENVFHWLPEVAFYPTWDDALQALREHVQ